MNPVLFTIGNFAIRWYSVLILIAVTIGIKLAQMEAKKFNIPAELIFNLAFWMVIFGLIGARAYYVIFNFAEYQDSLMSIFKIWEGGLAIHGGIIGGFLVVLFYSKKYNIRLAKLTDIIVVSLILGQAIGRWGNFFNGEAHGAATNLATLESVKIIPDFVIRGMLIEGVYYQPTFYYESLWCLLGFLILIIVRRLKYIKTGQLTSIYLVWYGIGRFFIETSRTDSLMFGGFKVAQVVSIIMVVTGLLMFLVLAKKGHFEDLYSESDKVEIRW
ncbi:MAG: prolipoprotein diacylglyceryl transferase [Bacilli bacterium]